MKAPGLRTAPFLPSALLLPLPSCFLPPSFLRPSTWFCRRGQLLLERGAFLAEVSLPARLF